MIETGIDKSNIVRIYNGINYHPVRELKDSEQLAKYRYLYFGRLGISKGLDLLLGAVQVLSKQDIEFEVKLIIPKSKNFLRSEVIKLIKDFNIEKYILLDGDLDKDSLQNELLKANCIVIPSYSEGFCFGAVETIALGKGIISSDQGALKEVVSGKFIKMQEFSISGLSKAMLEANNDNWGYTPIKKFELDETVMEYNKLYTNLLQK